MADMTDITQHPDWGLFTPEEQAAIRDQLAAAHTATVPPPPKNPPAPPVGAGDVLRLPYGVAKGAVSHTLGLPADLLNLVYGRGVNLPVGTGTLDAARPAKTPPFHIPAGSAEIGTRLDALMQMLGVMPPPPQTWGAVSQQVGEALGGMAGPGWLLRGARALGVAPQVMTDLLKLTSAGPVQDLVLGTAGELGNQVGGPVGAAVAPLAVAAGHGAVSSGVKAIGRRVLPRQAVQETLEGVQAAEPHVAEATAREAAALEQAKAREATRVLRATQGKTVADDAVEAMQARMAGVPPALETTLQSGVPSVPAVPAGRQARAAVEQTAAGERVALEQRYQRQVQDVAPYVDRLRTLDAAAQGFRESFRRGKAVINRAYKALENITGHEPIVDLTMTHGVTGALSREAEELGQRVPRGTSAFQRQGTAPIEGQRLTPQELQEIIQHSPRMRGPDGKPLGGAAFNATLEKLVREAEAGGTMEVPISLKMARRIRSIAGEGAWRNANPIGTISQGRWRQIWFGITEDLNRTLATHPEGAAIATAQGQANKLYIDSINLYNNSIVKHLMSRTPKVREQFLDAFVRTGNVTELATIREAATPEVWNLLSAHVLAEIAERASVNGVIDPRRLATQAKRLEAHGKIDLLLSPQQKAAFRATVQDMQAASGRPAPRLAARLANTEPGEIPQVVFAPGKQELTQDFKASTPSTAFGETVKAWAGRFGERMASATPEAIMKELRPMVRREGGNPSQLDVMLDQYPGVADQLADLVHQYDATRRSLPAAQRTALQAKQALTAETAAAAAEREATMRGPTAATAGAKAHLEVARLRHQQARNAAKMAPDDPVKARGVLHFPGGRVHGSLLATGAVELVAGLVYHHPVAVAAGATSIAADLASRGVMYGLENTATGQRWMREGLQRSYGPAAVRFAGQVLAQQQTPTSTPTPAAPQPVLTPDAVRAAMQQAKQDLHLQARPTDAEALARYRVQVSTILRAQGYDEAQVRQMVGGE